MGQPRWQRRAENRPGEICAAALEVFAECTETGVWPGYSDDIAYLSLPTWAAIRDTEEYL